MDKKVDVIYDAGKWTWSHSAHPGSKELEEGFEVLR